MLWMLRTFSSEIDAITAHFSMEFDAENHTFSRHSAENDTFNVVFSRLEPFRNLSQCNGEPIYVQSRQTRYAAETAAYNSKRDESQNSDPSRTAETAKTAELQNAQKGIFQNRRKRRKGIVERSAYPRFYTL